MGLAFHPAAGIILHDFTLIAYDVDFPIFHHLLNGQVLSCTHKRIFYIPADYGCQGVIVIGINFPVHGLKGIIIAKVHHCARKRKVAWIHRHLFADKGFDSVPLSTGFRHNRHTAFYHVASKDCQVHSGRNLLQRVACSCIRYNIHLARSQQRHCVGIGIGLNVLNCDSLVFQISLFLCNCQKHITACSAVPFYHALLRRVSTGSLFIRCCLFLCILPRCFF